jgi:hypothetical protein
VLIEKLKIVFLQTRFKIEEKHLNQMLEFMNKNRVYLVHNIQEAIPYGPSSVRNINGMIKNPRIENGDLFVDAETRDHIGRLITVVRNQLGSNSVAIKLAVNILPKEDSQEFDVNQILAGEIVNQ